MRTFINGRQNFNFGVGLITMFLVLGMAFAACDAPAGAEGPQGPEGPEGPVGPAGEDGSQIYANEGEPAADVGDTGDYYLDQNTGELYGPKDSDGWGEPGIVLNGEDGADGSQIHSGTGAPDASLGVVGDYYLDKDSYELYGPKTSNGWGTPLNLKGADGNANVTRYLFPGHDFFTEDPLVLRIDISGAAEFKESVWLIYVVDEMAQSTRNAWPIPGYGKASNTLYQSRYELRVEGDLQYYGQFRISIAEGNGESYDQIEIIQIESSETVDNRKQKADSIIPDHLDTSDYEAVAEYYGFGADSKQ